MSGLSEWRGQVVGIDGAPVAGAHIVVAVSSIPVPEIALVSDPNGRFSIRLPAGRFTLRAHGQGGASGELEVESGGKLDGIVIVVHP